MCAYSPMERWCWMWNGYMEPPKGPAGANVAAVSAAAVWWDSAGWIGVGS